MRMSYILRAGQGGRTPGMVFHILHKRIILILGTSFLVVMLVLLGFGYYLVTPAKEGGHDKDYVVTEGSTLKKVACELEKEKIITSSHLFILWARFRGHGKDIKAGEYKLGSGMSPVEILNVLTTGIVETHAITFPEGFTRRQIAKLLGEKGLADRDAFLSLTGQADVAMSYGISGPDLEGYLYPDTYRFAVGLPAKSVIDTMVKRFQEKVAPLREKVKQSGMTMEEVVILASIIEKETACAEERPIIASVFLNRLRKNMRFESDPTVIYGLKEFNGNLTRKDLVEHTPYNTYVIRGFPPGPIANPGIKAIEAVLFPAKTEYVFFVSKNNGTHYFSTTFAEHNQAVQTYQKNKTQTLNVEP